MSGCFFLKHGVYAEHNIVEINCAIV